MDSGSTGKDVVHGLLGRLRHLTAALEGVHGALAASNGEMTEENPSGPPMLSLSEPLIRELASLDLSVGSALAAVAREGISGPALHGAASSRTASVEAAAAAAALSRRAGETDLRASTREAAEAAAAAAEMKIAARAVDEAEAEEGDEWVEPSPYPGWTFAGCLGQRGRRETTVFAISGSPENQSP